MQNKTNSCRRDKLKCNTCNNSYAGQAGRSLGIRCKVHTRYVTTKNLVSSYSIHILLNEKHDFGNIEQNTELLNPCNKGVKMKIYQSKNRKSITPSLCKSWHKTLYYINRYPLPVPVSS
jgi:hypothetical protein